jgi:plastocyanin
MNGHVRWRRRGTVAACAGLVVALGAPSVGAAAPATVTAGGFNGPLVVAYNTFIPGQITVEQGTKVTFSIQGFHTVTFPKKGTKLIPFVIPGSTQNPPTNDPSGQPYWWGGTTPALGLNPAAPAPTGGTKVTGARTVSSGFVQGRRPSFTVSFPKKGTFQVRCIVHPRMKGTVKVVKKGSAAADTAAQIARAATRDTARLVKAAKRTARTAGRRAATAPVLIGPGDSRQEAFKFFPAASTVAPGGTVLFRMAGANEIHTVTFGPSDFLDAVGKRTFEGQGLALDPEGAYPSDPPAAVPSYLPTLHGNGYLNSGVLTEPGEPGTHAFRVTFPVAGVYQYRCLVHPDMRGQVTVG